MFHGVTQEYPHQFVIGNATVCRLLYDLSHYFYVTSVICCCAFFKWEAMNFDKIVHVVPPLFCHQHSWCATKSYISVAVAEFQYCDSSLVYSVHQWPQCTCPSHWMLLSNIDLSKLQGKFWQNVPLWVCCFRGCFFTKVGATRLPFPLWGYWIRAGTTVLWC